MQFNIHNKFSKHVNRLLHHCYNKLINFKILCSI